MAYRRQKFDEDKEIEVLLADIEKRKNKITRIGGFK